ncbi:MAG: S10 family peptidase [Armatimonadota bacterium]
MTRLPALRYLLPLALLLAAGIAAPGASQERQRPPQPVETAPPGPTAEPVRTVQEIRVDGRVLRYAVTTGFLPLTSDTGEKEAEVFFIAYTLEGDHKPAERPLMFSFNGGPGSSSVWLHLGALGPKRVKMLPDGNLPPAPYELVENPHTWLTESDLVFIDPVGTGYSRPARAEQGRRYWGLRGDIESVGDFIRLYLTRYERWASPLFLVGESYGTTRAAGLVGDLVEKGVAFNGVLLISSVLNFQTLRFGVGNDLPYQLYLPTYTATAWYHKKLPPELQRDLGRTLEEVERFTIEEYTPALMKGTNLSDAERRAVAQKVARYTGLSPEYVEQTNLRIEIFRFTKELLRDQRKTVGRLDSRFTGFDVDAAGESPDYDPSMTAIRPPYTAAFNDYVRRELGFRTDRTYHILGGGINAPWEWLRPGAQGYADTSDDLRAALVKNPYMKVFVGSGYFDLATPYFATEYTLSHLGLEKPLRNNLTVREYRAGHMMYIDEQELVKLRNDVVEFLRSAARR